MPIHAPAPPIACTRLIVCEKSGDWANALRRSLDDGGRWIVETRSHRQLVGALADHPSSLCLIEVTRENAARVAVCIEQLHQQHPQCRLIAACDRPLPIVERALHEAHAAYVLHSRRDVDILQRLWQRHCQIHPPREQSLREQIFASLPWS